LKLTLLGTVYTIWCKADKAKNMFIAGRRVMFIVHDYNIMINGLCKIKIVEKIVNIFEEMYSTNMIPNTITYNNPIDDLCKWGKIWYAWKLVGKMHIGGQPTIVLIYNSLLHTLWRIHHFDKTIVLVEKIKDQGISPDLYS